MSAANGTADQYSVADLAGIHDALARLAAVAQQPTEPQSSVEISRNSKGTTWTVKAYSPLGPGAAADMAQQVYDHLAATYGQPEPEA